MERGSSPWRRSTFLSTTTKAPKPDGALRSWPFAHIMERVYGTLWPHAPTTGRRTLHLSSTRNGISTLRTTRPATDASSMTTSPQGQSTASFNHLLTPTLARCKSGVRILPEEELYAEYGKNYWLDHLPSLSPEARRHCLQKYKYKACLLYTSPSPRDS